MSHLKELKPDFPTKTNPSAKKSKIKFKSSFCHLNFDKLNCRSILSNQRIQGRSQNRRICNVDSPLKCKPKIGFNHIPMLLGVYLHSIIIRQTVRIKPFCMEKFLFRKTCGNHMNRNLWLSKNHPFIIRKDERNRIISAL